MVRSAVFALCLAGAAIPSAALAATYKFTVNDADATLGGQPFSPYYFFLDSSPTPDSFDATTFTISGITYGTTFSADEVMDTYKFYTSSDFGGFDDEENVYSGSQLFTGSTDHPTFKLGTFDLDNFGSGATLTISAVGAGAVPEPATWGLMIVGFGLVGGVIRGRRASLRVRYA